MGKVTYIKTGFKESWKVLSQQRDDWRKIIKKDKAMKEGRKLYQNVITQKITIAECTIKKKNLGFI